MKTFTIADVAAATGVNKQTVRRRARELGIYDEMKVTDARGTMVMTAEQASILSDAVMKAVPSAIETIDEASSAEKAAEMGSAVVDALRETMKVKDALIEAQRSQIEELRSERDRILADADADAEAAREEIGRLNMEVQRLRDYARKLEHAHWWEKRGIINAFGVLPAASGD